MQATPGTPLNTDGQSTASHDRMPAPRRIRLFVVVAVLAYTLDVITKIVAVARLSDRAPIELLGGLLTLRLTSNPGAAFSLGTDFTIALSVVSIVVVAAVLWMARRVRTTMWACALGLLLGGAAGNLTDRLLREPGPLRGHVVDFLELPHWPVFNFADSAIVVAAVLIVLQSVRGISLDGRKIDS